jgi:hypothetical protein
VISYRIPVSHQHSFGDKVSQQLWLWLLRRQGLSNETRLGSVASIADHTLGLHAARLPSPFATVLARCIDPTVAMTLLTPPAERTVITVRCMRKTLHTLPFPLAEAAHAATIHFRERDALRAIVNAGLSISAISRVIEEVCTLLSDGPLFHRDIETCLVERKVAGTSAIRLAVKLAWERGILCYLNETSSWNRECRKFALTAATSPLLMMAMDRQDATRYLIQTYFDRYGPASVQDAVWWSGLSRAAVLAAMHEIDRSWIEVRTTWTESPMYMFNDRIEQFQATSSSGQRSETSFLAHEDIALKAYFETRSRYLAGLPKNEAFNQIGEALPTIVIDGHIVGIWHWSASRMHIEHRLFYHLTSKNRSEIARLAKALSNSLRLGWSAKSTTRETVSRISAPL